MSNALPHRWALPEHAQLIGYWVHESVSDSLWYRLTEDLPEIIPRGAYPVCDV